MRKVIASIVLVALGASAGYLLGAASPRPAPVVPAARVAVEHPPIVVTDLAPSAAELRRIVRAELAAGDRDQPAAAPAAPPPAPPGDPAAFDAGMQRVHQAIAQRRWTRDDAAALGRTLDALSPDQRTAILHTLIPALNRGEIRLAYRGELF